MMNNCNYNKTRLLHDLSRIEWYLKKHAKKDAKKHGHKECLKLCTELEKDLERHTAKLKNVIAELSRKGKFN